MFEMERSKTGYVTLRYNGKYIHSKYNPVKEAEQFANNNYNVIENNSTVVVYGLGLGYHILALNKLLKKKCNLYVFEYNYEIVDLCKKVNPEIFKIKNIHIIDGANKEFYKLLIEKINEVEDIIVHKPSLEFIKENEKLFNVINDFNNIKQFSKLDVVHQSIGAENKQYNIKKKYPHIENLLNTFKEISKPFLIVSAGPSIDFDIELIEKNKEKFIIICVGSALKTLMDKGIKPDIIVIIDPKEILRKQFEGYENIDSSLCFPASASRWAIDSYNGPKYIFGIENEKIHIQVGGTVAISAIDIAIKSGAHEIVLMGQDLAYFGEKSHTSAYEKIYGFKDSEKTRHKIRKVLGVDGEMLETCDGYLVFKHKIEQIIYANANIKFINCSHGAQIEGTISMHLNDYLSKN